MADVPPLTRETCEICRKHRGDGPLDGQLVARLEGFWVYHAPPGEDGLAPLGYLYVESDRHAPYLADLTAEEAAAVGRLRSQLAAALREALDPEFVFAAVIGAEAWPTSTSTCLRATREPRPRCPGMRVMRRHPGPTQDGSPSWSIG